MQTLLLTLTAAAGLLALLLPRRPLPAAVAERIAPFLDLLDARYLPLVLVAVPQSYTVYAWLLRDGVPAPVAAFGGAGFEFVYVGAIAWAARGAGWEAARPPAITALVFSVAVAVVHYHAHAGPLAVLHAGFPLVGYAYTVMMHAPNRRAAHGAPQRRWWWWGGVASSPAPVAQNPVSAATLRDVVAPARTDAPAPVALLADDAPVLAATPAHACRKCGEAVASAAHVSASARWGCAACKQGGAK